MLKIGQKVRIKSKTVPGFTYTASHLKEKYPLGVYEIEEVINLEEIGRLEYPYDVIYKKDPCFDEHFVYIIEGNFFRQSDLEPILIQQEFDF